MILNLQVTCKLYCLLGTRESENCGAPQYMNKAIYGCR